MTWKRFFTCCCCPRRNKPRKSTPVHVEVEQQEPALIVVQVHNQEEPVVQESMNQEESVVQVHNQEEPVVQVQEDVVQVQEEPVVHIHNQEEPVVQVQEDVVQEPMKQEEHVVQECNQADAEDTEEEKSTTTSKKKKRHRKKKSVDLSSLLHPSSPEYVVVSPQKHT